MLPTEIRAKRGEFVIPGLFKGMAEHGYWPLEVLEKNGVKVKFVEFTVGYLLNQSPSWPGRDLLQEIVKERLGDESSTLIFVGNGAMGEKHSDIISRGLGIGLNLAADFYCLNVGVLEFKRGIWVVGGTSYILRNEMGLEMRVVPLADKFELDKMTAGRLAEIYANERGFAAGYVEY